MSAKFDFGAESKLQAAMHKAAMPALYGPVSPLCDHCRQVAASEGSAFCEDCGEPCFCGAHNCSDRRHADNDEGRDR